MDCSENRTLLHAYADGELDLRESLDVERHLRSCPSCTVAAGNLQTLSAGLRSPALYHAMPDRFRDRALAAIGEPRAEARRSWRPLWQYAAVAASAPLLVALGWFFGGPAAAPELLAREVVQGHVRSLQADHLTDVPSSNQHTVKPWFDGKIDFAPPVPDLAAAGFPLVGGRLDYLGGRPVAALVYQRRLHVINVFVWPSAGDRERPPASLDGYNLVSWTRGGMTFWAVSDVSAADLKVFREAFER